MQERSYNRQPNIVEFSRALIQLFNLNKVLQNDKSCRQEFLYLHIKRVCYLTSSNYNLNRTKNY